MLASGARGHRFNSCRAHHPHRPGLHRRLASLASLGLVGCLATGGDAPNVVLVVVDDLGWRDLGCTGSDFHLTPRIDRLAAEGMLFTQAYASAANCAPSRAALLTGLYPPRTGVYTVGTSARGRRDRRRLVPIENELELGQGFLTVAEALRGAGYRTGAIGKWHLGVDPESGPRAQGFDVNVGGNLAGSLGTHFSPYSNPDLPDGPAGEYLTDRLTDEAIAFVRDNQRQRFFLYLSYYAVHVPIQPRPDLLERHAARTPGALHDDPAYAAMVAAVDENVGRLLDALERFGLEDDTLVLLTSDNGGFGRHTRMDPLRGSKGMYYEGGIRVPFLVRWPRRVAPGSRCDVPVIGLDFVPTCLELTGAPWPADRPLDGESLVPLVTATGGLERESLFWHFPAYLESAGVTEGPWRTTPCSALRKGDLKLLEFFEQGRLELYDLARDVGETHDLARERSAEALALHAELVRWRHSLGAAVPTVTNPAFVAEP